MTVPETMRAWVSGQAHGVDGLACETLPVPEPGPGELLVRVEAAALNYSDLLMLTDSYQVRPPRPFTPGQELAGTVVASGVETVAAPGERVAGKVLWGACAEFALMREAMSLPWPPALDAPAAAALPVVYQTVVVALTESTRLGPNETILIHGAAGGVGLAAVQVAGLLGGRIIATAGGAEKCAVAVDHGAHHGVDYTDPAWPEQVRRLAPDGVDVVLDPVGGDIAVNSLRCLAHGGRFLVVGFASGDIPALPANRLLLKRASAIGVYWNHDTDREMMVRVGERLVTLCERHKLRPVIGRRFGFEALPAALADLQTRRAIGKLVLSVGGPGPGGA